MIILGDLSRKFTSKHESFEIEDIYAHVFCKEEVVPSVTRNPFLRTFHTVGLLFNSLSKNSPHSLCQFMLKKLSFQLNLKHIYTKAIKI